MFDVIREWVMTVLGEYNPITYVHSIYNSAGELLGTEEIVANGLSGLDWEYIATAALLVIVIYSVFRLLGVLLQGLMGGGKR